MASSPPGVTTSAGVSDMPSGSGDNDQDPRLPDICDLQWQRQGMPDTEFNRKYPPDAWGEEAAPNARVWKMYRDHQTVSDGGMLDSWNKTLDVLLIFAGLFSAVLTAFLIESYKALQPDYTQYLAVFLYAAAVSQNSTGGILPALDTIVAPERFIQTSSAQRLTNGLWFSSLVISLTVALLSILIKQWLDEYNSHVASAAISPKYWAQRRCMYYLGLEGWGVPVLISFLPLLLHLSLFLFFGGLVLLLLPLDGAIAYFLLVMVSSIFTFYSLSLLLPAWRVDCPSYTPLFAHALVTVSRGISCLIYLIIRLSRLLRSLIRFPHESCLHQMLGALESIAYDVAWDMYLARSGSTGGTHWQQQWRERLAIYRCDKELDGHVLSALLNLPFDSTPGIVQAACTAIGAVTSIRTTEIISSKVSGDIFDMINKCLNSMTLHPSGFVITTHAQLRRAYKVLEIQNHSRHTMFTYPAYSPGLRSSLGIDGLLLQAMGVADADKQPFDINVLFHSLQSLPAATDVSRGFPLRSMCLMFLEHRSKYPLPDPLFLSCFLLVFCAGQFSSANMHESVRALNSVRHLLRRRCSIDVPLAHNDDEHETTRAAINGLWIMLLDPERYQVDSLTACRVADRAQAWSHCHEYRGWSHLSAFICSPSFGRCVSTADDLEQYFWLCYRARNRICGESQVAEYWACIVTLLQVKTACEDSFGPDRPVNRFEYGLRLFPLHPNDWEFLKSDGEFSLPEKTAEWQEQGLSAFLAGPNAIATWGHVIPSRCDPEGADDLLNLASRISIILYRRQRLHLSNEAFIRGFFSGTFILDLLRDIVSREQIPSKPVDEAALSLAMHCLKLAPERFTGICSQLEETGEPGSELRPRAVAFAKRALSADCTATCPCKIEPSPPARGWRDVWNDRVARLWCGSGQGATVEYV